MQEEQTRVPGRYGKEEIAHNELEPWPNAHPDRNYVTHLEIPEFTCLCPRSGFPDFATIVIDYVPDQYVMELKSLKLYINGYRDRQISHESATNTILNDLVEHGEITRDEIYTHPKRNQIYRCLGDHAAVDIDTFTVALPVGDLLLLCSDGLWEMVHDQEMQAIVEMCATRPTQLSAKLVQAALQQGGADNISVIVVRSA